LHKPKRLAPLEQAVVERQLELVPQPLRRLVA
jgi:hypothetical protein